MQSSDSKWEGPRLARRRVVGLLGGSFNPAHEGHRHISLVALKRLGLDEVWWLVSPGNPLKDHRELAAYDKRVAAAARLMRHPRLHVSTFEAKNSLTYTAETLARIKQHYQDVRFIWLMGADNLATVHLWRRWQDIFNLVRVAVVDRPGYRYQALASPAAARFAARKVDESDAPALCRLAAPAWVYLSGPLSPLSSTQLRRGKYKGAGGHA